MLHRWSGEQVPVVRFVTGREALMLPEVFEADVHTSGVCKRIQVRCQASATRTPLLDGMESQRGIPVVRQSLTACCCAGACCPASS